MSLESCRCVTAYAHSLSEQAQHREARPDREGPHRGHEHPRHVSTSYVERQNLTMRMSMRRFTRLTNAFSKKVENHAHAVALHFAVYNFVRVHQTLRVTPAMEAGIADHVWTIEDLCRLVPEPKAAPWGTKNGRRPEPNSK